MKRIIIFFITGLAAVALISCSSSSVKNEAGSTAGLNAYKAVHIGALSIDKNTWKDLGYKSEQEWVTAINAVDSAFQAAVKENAAGKELSFGTKASKKAQIEVSFANTKVDRGYKFMVGPWGSLLTTMTIKNIKDKKTLYTVTLEARKKGSFSLDVQLKKSAQEIAEALAKILSK